MGFSSLILPQILISSKPKTKSVFRGSALIKHISTMAFNWRVVVVGAAGVLLRMLIRLHGMRATTSNLLIPPRILAALRAHRLLIAHGRAAAVCHLWLVASSVTKIKFIRILHLFANFAVWAINIIIYQLSLRQNGPIVIVGEILPKLWWACRDRLLETTRTLTVAQLLALVWDAFGAVEFVGLTEVVPPRLLLHNQKLTLLIPIHLRWIGHPHIVQRGPWPHRKLGFQLLVHIGVNRRPEILRWIQLILIDINSEVKSLHYCRGNVLDFWESWHDLGLQQGSLLHAFQLLIPLIDDNIETIV